uniref:RING-type domain-containing protein n=1 Tax=Aegilops tauschii subsp. strangulata TaxID=200361 RepID=A0A453DDF6_AEGTS
SNGNSRLDGNSELFYCPMCTTTAPIIHKSSFGSCGHAFCNSCVAKYIAVRQRENVALPVECPECEDDACRDPLLNSDGDGNEDSSADGNDVGDGKRFYCAKCMHVVPCACIRRSFTSCAHDFCSNCVSRRLQGRRGDGQRRFAGRRRRRALRLRHLHGNGARHPQVHHQLVRPRLLLQLRRPVRGREAGRQCLSHRMPAARLRGRHHRAGELPRHHPHGPPRQVGFATMRARGRRQEDILPVPRVLGALAHRRRGRGGGHRRGGMPALPPAFLRPVRRAMARRLRVRGVPEARAGRARPGGPPAQGPRRQGGLAAVPRVPDVRGEIGRVQLHQVQVWIQLLLPMRIRVVCAKPLLQQVQA